MFIVEVTIVAGRSPEQHEALHGAIAATVQRTVGLPAAEVRSVIRELPKTHWGIGGRSVAARESSDG